MFYAASVISMSTVDGEEGVVGEKGEGGVKEEEKKWLCDEVEEEGLEQEVVGGAQEEEDMCIRRYTSMRRCPPTSTKATRSRRVRTFIILWKRNL